MDDEGKRPPERGSSDVQFHWSIRSHRRGSSGPRLVAPAGVSRHCSPASTYQPSGPGCVCTLELSPGRMTAYESTAAVALCCGSCSGPTMAIASPPARARSRGPNSGEPRSAVFLHDDSGCTLGRLRRLPGWKRVQMPVDGCFTEMKSGDGADVEAAKLRPLFTRPHVNTGHFGQVLVSGDAGHLSSEMPDRRDSKGEHEQSEDCDELESWRSPNLREDADGAGLVRTSCTHIGPAEAISSPKAWPPRASRGATSRALRDTATHPVQSRMIH